MRSLIQQLDHSDEKMAWDIQRVQQPAYQIEADLMGFQGIPQLAESVQDIQRSKEFFTGFVEGELKGFISYKKEKGIIDIYRLVVHPHHFRQGIAKKLLAYLMAQYDGLEFKVSTGTANEPAKSLYRSFGFIEQDQFEAAPGITCTHFAKQS